MNPTSANTLLPSLPELLAELVSAPGPPGQEDAIREVVKGYVDHMGLSSRVDAKGNLLTWLGDSFPERPDVVVTAHLDEIALMVRAVHPHGELAVSALGGVYPWKWGEGPVEILGEQIVPGILSFGSIHTTSPHAVPQQIREGKPLTWEQTRIVTGLSTDVLRRLRIREGTRVVMARERRKLWEIGNNLLGSYFFDDRADIAAWLLALERLIQTPIPRQKGILFAVTTSEEVGGEGALYLLHEYRPPVCIALEIGPSTPDAPFPVDSTPTLWVSDSFAAMSPRDILRVEDAAQEAGLGLYRQALSRGGSDASCAASKGLCARPITLAFAAENSHGFEIMHRDAPQNLATLLVTLLKNGVIPNPA